MNSSLTISTVQKKLQQLETTIKQLIQQEGKLGDLLARSSDSVWENPNPEPTYDHYLDLMGHNEHRIHYYNQLLGYIEKMRMVSKNIVLEQEGIDTMSNEETELPISQTDIPLDQESTIQNFSFLSDHKAFAEAIEYLDKENDVIVKMEVSQDACILTRENHWVKVNIHKVIGHGVIFVEYYRLRNALLRDHRSFYHVRYQGGTLFISDDIAFHVLSLKS